MSVVRVSWSRLEVEAAVADYLEMLRKELAREPYSKTAPLVESAELGDTHVAFGKVCDDLE